MSGAGLTPNWVEELLRREHKKIDEVWTTTFARDFKRFLNTHTNTTAPTTDDQLSTFQSYIVNEFALTNLKTLYLNLNHFHQYIQSKRPPPSTGGPPPPNIIYTPFNSASHFLEFYFLRLMGSLKVDLVDSLRQFLESEKGRNAVVDQVKRQELMDLSVQDGTAHSFDIIPVMPKATRSVRTLRSEDCGQLLILTGVVTRCSDVKPELRYGTFECQACQSVRECVEQQYKFTEPTFCWTQSCGNRTKWTIRLEESIFGDWQKLRIQQSATDDVPAGTVPRTIDVVARGPAVERCKPGDRVQLTGCLLAVPDVPAMLKPSEITKGMGTERNRALQSEAGMTEANVKGLAKLGVRELGYKQIFLALHVQVHSKEQVNAPASSGAAFLTANSAAGRLVRQFINISPGTEPSDELNELISHPLLRHLNLTSDLHRRFKQVAQSLNCLDRLTALVAPEICGSTDVKKGILLMLVGGVEKTTRKDHIKLRGDINVCIVGDPGTAKSQLLKWVQTFADRAIFTSGKSSTAAGLTASVHKDPEQGEAVVEAGALILADNGVCCIDEFDKMADKDMVAIHEAMEQQTISISKAGVQATMNARASVLAACNPVDGRYDITKRLRENLKLSPTILSRFDLIFVLLDKASDEEDRRIAQHVLSLCAGQPAQTASVAKGSAIHNHHELKTYLRIAKVFRPRLTREAKNVLVRHYVTFRQRDAVAGEKRSMRITVRQLESMLRISEGVAKLHFSSTVTKEHAEAAVNIFGNCLTRVRTEPIELIESDVEDEDTEVTIEEESRPEPIVLDSGLYDLIQSQILNRVRSIEERMVADPDTFDSLLKEKKRCSLVDWYLKEYNSDLTDDEDISFERRKFELILRRMIRNGVAFLEAEDVIRIHPNVAAGSNVRSEQLVSSEVGAAASAVVSTAVAGDTGSLEIADGDFLSMLYPR